VLLENSVPNPYVPPGPVPPQPTTEQELLFEHENRIRALEGQRPISVGDFMTDGARISIRENQALAIGLIGQAVVLGIYMVNLEARVSTLEIRGSPHLEKIDARLTVLEATTAENKARLEKVTDVMTRRLNINP